MHPSRSRLQRLAFFATLLLLLASLAAFARGWIYSEMFAKIPWTGEGAQRAALLSAAFWAAFLAIVASGRRVLPLKLAAAAVIAVASCVGPMPVVATAYLFGSGCALGLGILSRGGRTPIDAAGLPLCAALGTGLIGSVLPVLGLWPVNTAFVYFVLLALPIFWQGRVLVRMLGTSLRRSAEDVGWGDLFLLGAIGNVMALHVTSALLPEVGNDALAFHLGVAAHVADFGFWHYDVTRVAPAVFPLGVNFLYASAYMFGGEVAARLVNVSALLLVLALVYGYVRERGDRFAALVAVLVAAASPLVFLEASTLLIDNAWSLFVVGALLALLQFARGGDLARLFGGSALLGAALSAKAISAAAYPGAVLIVVLALARRARPRPWLALGAALLVGVALALPPYAIALMKTGNPVFPFMNEVFRSPLYIPANISVFAGSLDPLLLYRMTFYSDLHIEGLPGSLGFAPLLLVPPLVVAAPAWGRRGAGMLLLVAALFALVVLLGVGYAIRYLYPALFLVAMAFGLALAGLRQRGGLLPGTLTAVALLAVIASMLFLPAAFAPGKAFPLAPLIDTEARRAYVSMWAAQRHAISVLNALPDDHPVAFLGGKPFLAGLTRRGYVDSSYVLPFFGRGRALASRADLAAIVHEFDLGYLVLDASAEGRLREPVASVAKPLVAVEGSTVFRVDSRVRYPAELLKGFGFGLDAGSWHRHGEPVVDSANGTALVNAADVLWQRVPVTGGKSYRYGVQSRCHRERGEVRLQVIWHAADERTWLSFRSVGCTTDWTEEEAVFTAPAEAVAAVVFALGHDQRYVEVRDVSLRGR